MTHISRSALLPHDARRLFDLVNDVEAYPQYMGGCVGAQVLRREAHLVEARLDLARGGVRQSFSTRNHLVPGREIVLELLDGPFDQFQGRWDFQQLGDAGCKMSLDLQFRINSRVLGVAATKLFDRVSNDLVDAVAQRARTLYG
ncbi:MAG: ubiquinone-binding protein [Halioglobus sp.]|nr:ubiquinone-binding protein [Halioglobus sp.]|tara:strand:+ start:686 stop:1117 length:432 start_codon:yes stop_codon:yes gene_type:complete